MRDFPSYQCKIIEDVSFEGKPNISVPTDSNTTLSWGTSAGTRVIVGKVQGSRLYAKFLTPNVNTGIGTFERTTEFLITEGTVRMALSGGRQGVIDKMADFRLVELPNSMRGFHFGSGNEYFDVFNESNTDVSGSNGLISVDCSDTRRKGVYVFDSNKDNQCISWEAQGESGKVVEWTEFEGHSVPRKVVSTIDDFFGARRTTTCTTTYDKLAPDGFGDVTWSEGSWVKDNITKKIYRVQGKALVIDEQGTALLSKAIILDRVKTFAGVFLTLAGMLLLLRRFFVNSKTKKRFIES